MEDMIDLTEFTKAVSALNILGYETRVLSYLGGGICQLYDTAGNLLCDFICHSGSYGHKDGLLEGMGECFKSEDESESVMGWLTAQEVVARITATINVKDTVCAGDKEEN